MGVKTGKVPRGGLEGNWIFGGFDGGGAKKGKSKEGVMIQSEGIVMKS